MIRTIIVDDEILSRIGIQSFIDGKEEISVAGTFGEAEEALAFLRENSVDVVITDIEMSEMNGLDFIKIIRQEELAQGVIILSCHEDFSYAQEAIANGTDSYLLKHNVTEKKLIEEVKKVYQKTMKSNSGSRLKSVLQKEDAEEEGIYVIGMMEIASAVNRAGIKQENLTEDVMLVHLLEDIMERGKMGTVFSPYNRDVFAVFRFQKDASEDEVREALENNIQIIEKNMKQYINGRILFGISSYFTDLRLMREKYEEAAEALESSFYEPEKEGFLYRQKNVQWKVPAFSTEDFLEKQGVEKFESELTVVLNKAAFLEVKVSRLKENLIQSVLLMMYQIIKNSNAGREFADKWNSEAEIVSVIQSASDKKMMEQKILETVSEFRRKLQEELGNDEFSEVFQYIDRHLAENITLGEVSDLACMSVPSFCKKFKEKTGLTMVQYMNEMRIKKAKLLLKNQKNTLEQVAEQTGFSNANYLVRVFKKVTGQTVSEYRRKYEICE